MAFSGWPPEAVEFFAGLHADNSKAYWQAHKAVYESSVRAPMAELLAELADEFGPGRIARPYRDVRFRADKAPYKTEIYATLDAGGFVRLGADGLRTALGAFGMGGDRLERYRRAVEDEEHGARLAEVVAELRARGVEVGGVQTLKSAPRGYPKDHPRIELLRWKGIIAWRSWPVSPWLGTTEAKTRVVEFLRTAAPLRHWLDERAGEPGIG